MRYRALLIDADNTLFDFDASERRAIDLVIARLGIADPQAHQVYHRINDSYWKALERREITHAELSVNRFRDFLAHYRLAADLRETARYYEAELTREAVLYPGALQTVAEISRHMPVAIVTNGISSVQHARFDSSPIRPYVSALVISEELGAEKPDPAILFAALEQLGGIPVEAALMIGDSLSSDIPAANRAGVDAYWYNPKRLARPEHLKIKGELRDIRDAVRIACG